MTDQRVSKVQADIVGQEAAPGMAAGQTLAEVIANLAEVADLQVGQTIAEVVGFDTPRTLYAGQTLVELIGWVGTFHLDLVAMYAGVGGRSMIWNTHVRAVGASLPAQLVYTIVAGPTHGVVLRDSPEPSVTWSPVTTFTQADINGGYLAYQNTSTAPGADSITLSASYAGGAPVTSVLPITVLASSDSGLDPTVYVADRFYVAPALELCPVPLGPDVFVHPAGIT